MADEKPWYNHLISVFFENAERLEMKGRRLLLLLLAAMAYLAIYFGMEAWTAGGLMVVAYLLEPGGELVREWCGRRDDHSRLIEVQQDAAKRIGYAKDALRKDEPELPMLLDPPGGEGS